MEHGPCQSCAANSSSNDVRIIRPLRRKIHSTGSTVTPTGLTSEKSRLSATVL